MNSLSWSGCPLLTSDPEVVHGEPVFTGTRLPASTIVDNVLAYLDEGLNFEEAIQQTVESFPTVPGGAEGVHRLLAFQELHQAKPAR